MNLVTTIGSAQLSFFSKIFSKISANSSFEPICIKDSKLQRHLNSSTVYCNFEKLFDNKDVTLNILDHQKASKLFKTIKTDNPVSIFEDEEYYYIIYKYTAGNKEYTFTLTLLKADECNDINDLDEIQNLEKTDEKLIEHETYDTLKNVYKATPDKDVLFYLDDNDKIVAIGIEDSGHVVLDENVEKFSPNDAAKTLKTTSFFIFDPEEVKIELYKDDDVYKVVYNLEFGFPIDFKVVENLTDLDNELDI